MTTPDVFVRAMRSIHSSVMRITCYVELKMHKRMTITIDEAVYEGFYRTIGKRRMSQFIEDLLRPHVMDSALDDGYRAMAEDKAREAEAMQWCNAVVADMAVEAR
jgi:predicted CopG family antitoxin